MTLHKDTESVKLHYAGLAENVKTITAAATGATNQTANFQPTLQAITPSSGTEIDLYVPGDVGGTGSSGSQTFTEAGFTGATYQQSFSSTFTQTSGYFDDVRPHRNGQPGHRRECRRVLGYRGDGCGHADRRQLPTSRSTTA